MRVSERTAAAGTKEVSGAEERKPHERSAKEARWSRWKGKKKDGDVIKRK